jgi:cobalt/nickel transport system permease protein
VSTGHGADALYRPGTSPVHRLAPEVKIVAAVTFAVTVVVTPREAFWAFGAYAILITLVAALARIPPGWLARRVPIAAPFLVFAFALPFLGGGQRVSVAGVALSVDGLLGGWNLLAKTLLGLCASLLLVGTTTVRDLMLGLDRLRCPSALTQIATLMLRYLDVVLAEARRMRVARLSRGDDPRFLWQARGFAAGLGALFLRAYERGERVWLAMRSRGFTGRTPLAWHEAGVATVRQWTVAASVPLTAAAVAVAAVVIR